MTGDRLDVTAVRRRVVPLTTQVYVWLAFFVGASAPAIGYAVAVTFGWLR